MRGDDEEGKGRVGVGGRGGGGGGGGRVVESKVGDFPPTCDELAFEEAKKGDPPPRTGDVPKLLTRRMRFAGPLVMR